MRKTAHFWTATILALCCMLPVASVTYAAEHLPAKTTEIETSSRISEMMLTALSLIGVNYKFGGNTPESGFDCSGFVRYLFSNALALDLPRSSFEMGKRGLKVAKSELQMGDLVFYNTRRRAFSHVGVYIGDGRFVHAPSRGKSVETVDMSDPYWVRRFNGARRLHETNNEFVGPQQPTADLSANTKENATSE
jgi:cell wall-associated NlpC family hydrolase